VILGRFALTANEECGDEIHAECRLGSRIPAVLPGERRAQVFDGAGITQTGEAVSSPSGKVRLVEHEIRQRVIRCCR
jgi:hypothetical protein